MDSLLTYSFRLQLKALILGVVVCISFYALDHSGGRDPFFKCIEDYLQFITIPYLCTIAFYYHDGRTNLKELIKSLTIVSVIVYILKYLINATRPNGTGGFSFPSGHTSFAFTIATMIHKRYHLYYAIPAYLNGVLIGYLRVYHGKHYLHDVIAGAIIAILLTWKIVSKREVEMPLAKSS